MRENVNYIIIKQIYNVWHRRQGWHHGRSSVLNFRYNKMLIISSLIASLFVDSGARRGFCRSRARRKCPQFCDLGRPGIRAPCETAVRVVCVEALIF